MDWSRLCMGCMEATEAAAVCPRCGWQEGTRAHSVLQLAPRTPIADRYLLGRVLGQGGFGITYIGWDTAHERKVAVKEYLPQAIATRASQSPEVVPASEQTSEHYSYGLERFLEEARVLMLFKDHPCIVSFFGFERFNGTAYLIMEYLDGVTLAEYLLQQGGRIRSDLALPIMMVVLDGLREVHARGLLHRDISPDNIFLTRSRQIKILDFGASRMALGVRSQNLSVILKPGYAPIEQYRANSRQGPYTDIYAAGATFYRAITGITPPVSMDRMTRDTLVPPSRTVNVPRQVEASLLKAMAVEESRRFSTVDQFQQALSNHDPGFQVPALVDDPGGLPKAPRMWQAYLVGILLSLAITYVFGGYEMHVIEQMQAQKQGSGYRPTRVSAAGSGLAPSPGGGGAQAPENEQPVIFNSTLEANLDGDEFVGAVEFDAVHMAGRTGCVALAFADASTRQLLKKESGDPIQFLQEYSPHQDRERFRLSFREPASVFNTATQTTTVATRAFFFANPCRVQNDTVIDRSQSVTIELHHS